MSSASSEDDTMLHANAFGYESCDVPEGLTLAEYRRDRPVCRAPQQPKPGALIRLRVLRRRERAAA